MELIKALRRFIEKYYYDALLDVVKSGHQSLIIDFGDLLRFDPIIAEKLIEKPNETLRIFEDAVTEFDTLDLEKPIKIRIKNLPNSQQIPIRNFRSEHLGKLLQFKGVIRQTSDIRPKVTTAKFECPSCAAQILVMQKDSKFHEPERCQCGRKGKFKLTDKKLVDVQRLFLEEAPESLSGGEQAKRIRVYLTGDLLDPKLEKRRYPGNKVRVVGVLEEIPITVRTGGTSTTYDLIVEVNSIETVEEDYEDVVISPENIKEIEELASKPNIYEKLVNSIAPSIFGYEDIKEAIALQLFGGTRKIRKDGTSTRGDIHVFLIGDPGAGKSEILKFTSVLAPKSRFVSGKGATGAGLTAAVVKDEFMHGWALEAGALVLAHKGIACLDELDKMGSEDRAAMHEALEQQTVSITKANIQATLRCQTSVLAAANPKFGRFDPYSPIGKQIDLPTTLINRFDLIFTVMDSPSVEKDENIAKHILELAKDEDYTKADIHHLLLRKYIAYAKQNCKPILTQGALEEIKDFYVNLRSAAALEDREVKSIPISARQLEALVRLSEASAKVRLADKVTKRDAQRAIRLLNACMRSVGTDPETGKFDIDRIVTGITASQRSRISTVRKIISDLEAQLGKNIPISDILKEGETQGIDRSRMDDIIDELKKKGDVFEPKPGVIQRV